MLTDCPSGRRVGAVALLCLILTSPVCLARWYTYEVCTLVHNKANDGDSFHVRTKSDEKIFRLYFVDAPETDNTILERNAEQAAYWDIDEDRVLALGQQAKEFTEEFLTGTFTVYSQREDARGRSKLPRFYAFVKKDDKYLSQELVRNGLARIYGKYTNLPEGKKGWKFQADLRVAERAAKREGKGGWAKKGLLESGGRAPEPVEEQDLELSRNTAVYSLETPPRFMGILNRGAKVRVLRAESADWVRIRFNAGKEEREGQSRRRDLGL